MMAALAVTIAAATAESIPATARLAGRLASWAAYRRYASDPDRAARRAEEWQALTCRRPGGRMLGMLTAAGFALVEVRALFPARRVTGAPAVQSAGIHGEGTAILSVPAGLAPRASLEPGFAELDAAVTAIYTAHYRPLVRLADLLVCDVATAEEVVQDSFIALYAAGGQLQDTEQVLSHLRQSVVSRSRSVLRQRMVVGKHAPKPASAEPEVCSAPERSAVITALRELPPQQREALVLRYYGGLCEAQIAAAMGISRGALKSHTARAIAALRAVLELDKT